MLVPVRAFSMCVTLSIVIATGCGDDDGDGRSACSVEQRDGGGAVIRCGDGTSAVIDGDALGAGCSIERNDGGTKTIRCSDGTVVTIEDGKQGPPGTSGKDGENGDDGTPGQNGEPGAEGMDGQDGAPGTGGTDGPGNVITGPGLQIEITDVSIPEDRQPLVSLTIEDDAGRPLDRLGQSSPGPVSVSFVLAYLASENGVVGQYVPYTTATVTGMTVENTPPAMASATQPKSESGGTWSVVDRAAGSYTYRFATALPEDYDTERTHTLAIYASRTLDGVQYASDPVFHFRPDGEEVSETREIVTTETCNKCHDTLRVHGGSRRDLGLCITCHTAGMHDPESGNSLDMKQMIHKIHRGKNLPSVAGGTPYRIVGHNNTVHDYSDVAFPQAMENCTTCHQGGEHSDFWKTRFSRDACTSCHDRTNFEETTPPGFTDHTADAVTDDSLCAGCHREGRPHIGPFEVDVTKVHVPQTEWPLRDASGNLVSNAPVLTGAILSVTGVASGQTPVVTFSVALDGQPYDILAGGQALSSLRFTFAAPTTDYAGYSQYTAQGSGAVGSLDAGGNPGEFVWTASQTIDDIANAVGGATGSQPFPRTGTMAVGMEGRISRPATKPDGTQIASVNHAMRNAVFYVALTDSSPVPRREATAVENCNTCHGDLSAHGGSRNDPEYCVLCHIAGRDTITRMPAPATGLARTTNLRMSQMVHRIHTGKEGQNPYVAYGNGGDAIDFGEVRFPGDLRNCVHCHVPGQYALPLPAGLLASRVSDIDGARARVASYYMGATAAACFGCHDGESTAVHAATMSIISPGNPANIEESCASCHAAGREFGIDVSHARLGL